MEDQVQVWPPAGLAKPAQRALVNADINSLAELANRPLHEVAALHGMGPNALARLHQALESAGLSFR